MRMEEYVTKRVSAAILFTDGESFLACKPTNIDYWELPKGQLDGSEEPVNAAVREFKEETNYTLKKDRLELFGKFPFHSGKNIIMFIYRVDKLPPIGIFKCMSYTHAYDKPELEVEKFRYFNLDDFTRLRSEFQYSMAAAYRKIKGEEK